MSTEYLNNKTFERLIIQFQKCKKQKIRYQYFVQDIKDTDARTQKRGNYNKPELWSNIEKEFQIASTSFQDSQKELAIAFYTLSENIVRYAKFNLIDIDDAVQEGVMICFEKIDRFDPEKGKAFNYMTTCILNHFRQMYRTARNYNELKKRYLDWVKIQNERQFPQSKKGIFKKHNVSNDT
jgi:DNA-directed RNA polymerase specialized sigma subunit